MRALKYILVLLTGLLIVLVTLEATADDKEIFTPVFAEEVTNPQPVDESALAALQSLEERNVGEVVQELSSISESRWIVESVSMSESQSVEESVRMSSIFEAESIAQSEAESIYASSVEQAQKEYEWAAMTAPLAGSHLLPGQVSYELDDTDIPYLRALFSNCIVIGNSRAKNAVDCGIFTSAEIVFMSGASVEQITPVALNTAYMYKPKTLFVMGLNDIGYYDGSNARFKEDYYSMIANYQAINPGIIYLQEILPCPEEARPYFYRFFMIPDFNARIMEVCQERNCLYVSATPYADFKYINSEDHAHYGKEFYFLWAQTIANQMHLWEDLAGLGYEVDYAKYYQ